MMSLSAYGRRRGCSHEAVRRAIKSGRLSESVVIDKKGHPKIADPDLADQEWGANTSQIMQVDQKAVGDGVSRAKGGDGTTRAPTTRPSANGSGGGTGSDSALNKARAAKETFAARIEEFKYKKMQHELVDAAEVKTEFATASRRIKNNLLTIPDRISSILAADTNTDSVHELLTKEIEQALTALADEGGFPGDG